MSFVLVTDSRTAEVRGSSYICGIGLAHDDVEDGDVTAVLAGVCRNHAVLGL